MYGKQHLSRFTALLAVMRVVAWGGGGRPPVLAYTIDCKR